MVSSRSGQLFHYFPDGKEQLLLAVARHEAERILSDQQPHLSELTSWSAWRSWRDAVVDRYRRQGQTCPLAALTSHLGRSSPAAQAVVIQLIGHQQAGLAAGIRAMQRSGDVAAGLSADLTAAALVASIQGGVMILLTTGRLDHLEAALDVALRNLRSEPLFAESLTNDRPSNQQTAPEDGGSGSSRSRCTN
jgi:AcrR family transcriptional regulator